MTKNQKNILSAINGLPKEYRVNNQAGGTIKIQHIESYDGRTINSLTRKGWLSYSEHGVLVTNSGKLALKASTNQGS